MTTGFGRNVGLAVLGLAALACARGAAEVEELERYPIANQEGVISRDGVRFDAETSSDGNGSLKIVADKPRTVRLYETGDLDVEQAKLVYRARLRTDGVEGRVYLEMWCRFPGKGEYFSRALQAPLSGTTGWASQQTSFFLQAGDNPDNIKLNLVIDGTGTVWIDDLVLDKEPL